MPLNIEFLDVQAAHTGNTVEEDFRRRYPAKNAPILNISVVGWRCLFGHRDEHIILEWPH